MTSLAHQPSAVRPQVPQSLPDWGLELRQAIRNPVALCEALGLPSDLADRAMAAAGDFSVLVPQPYLSRMQRGDPQDPLLLQVLPQSAETVPQTGFAEDAVGDHEATVVPGLLQKYAGRALLIVSGACAVHCRYCFRRHFPYSETPKGIEAWKEALQHIAEDPSLSEVILSGGDPLMLVDDSLNQLIEHLDAIPHLRRLRIHTRLPVVIPQRVTDQLMDTLNRTRLTKVIVLHCNHANEIDAAVSFAMERLAATGALLLNQSVFLRGVNDSVESLAALSYRLIDAGVLPYYLHQLDRVTGASHFEPEDALGERLIAKLREQLPGYAVPRYVVEEAGKPHKTPIA